MIKIWSLVVVSLWVVPGCAQTAAPQPKQSGGYRTGSRLPSYDPDGGSASTGSVSKDDYTDEMRRGINPGQRF